MYQLLVFFTKALEFFKIFLTLCCLKIFSLITYLMHALSLISLWPQAGTTAILNCSFYLHSEDIYSVKWYKVILYNLYTPFPLLLPLLCFFQDTLQFFSYIPEQSPSTWFSPMKDMELNVSSKFPIHFNPSLSCILWANVYVCMYIYTIYTYIC